ncbi:tRNA lysidine(34) synthetase TilS [Sphingomonas sp. M1-B02]|uniref:tRNA lysidine(34) synthetase TilS n=1 Tax=Sphingomonas sp. M1-B02 TaxID=3114300 RepID=UPI002240A7E1|nr:tRNA lysidine(34) synthetase TilS [Sphingomonas sp. S6-11]UZK65116.1 tRNA lysidine(34) synthetase TilS [Sphingomonas sp. S6-11]
MIPTPDAAAVARFRADMEALGETLFPLALAVSGGPDSMAMLLLATAAFPGEVAAATVDHRLREGAAEEARLVGAICAQLDVPHEVLVPAVPIVGASIQAQARAARYRLLADWAGHIGAHALLTAHHADDQAETFLMRAVRGSGVAGLASIRPRRALDGMLLLRPLLGWRRAELLALVAGVPTADDPSNRDDMHDRTHFRRLLAENDLLDVPGLARAATHASEAEEALALLAEHFWTERRTPQGLDLAGLPREIRRRLLRRAITELREAERIASPPWSEASNIEPLIQLLEAGRSGTQAGVQISKSGNLVNFRKAPPRRSH